MAIIPITDKVLFWDPTNPINQIAMANANNSDTAYTMQDIINTVSYSGGSIDGSGTANYISKFTDSNTIADSPLLVNNYTPGDGLAEVKVTDGYRFILDRASAAGAGGDQEFSITQDDIKKVSFGWDDDGGGYGFLYNWAGNGWRLGASGANPVIEITTVTGGASSIGVEITGDLKLTGGFKDAASSFGTAGQVLSSTGTTTSWINSGGGVDGISSVYIAGTGTPSENGTELIDGYTAAVAKVQTLTNISSIIINFDQDNGSGNYHIFTPPNAFSGLVLNTNYTASYGTTPAQTLIWRITSVGGSDFQVLITDTAGVPQAGLTIDTAGVPILSAQTIPAHLIIGPGEYALPSSLVINDLVSVISLTGQKDVNITGFDVQVSSGANATTTIIAGLNLQNNKFIVDTQLGDITVKNVEARASGSFDAAAGGGNLSGTFIDCFSGSESFASSNGANASGTFIRCDSRRPGNTAGFSFGGSSGTTSGYFDSCGSLTGNNDSGGGYANFGRSGSSLGGYFYYCKGQNQSFGSSNGNVGGKFISCQTSGSSSFGASSGSNSGTFSYCTGGANSYGSNPQVGAQTTSAYYYYCIAEGDENFGTNPFGDRAQSTYVGCVSNANSFGGAPFGTSQTEGKLFNCMLQNGTYAPVFGAGKIRNSIDNTFTLINLG